MVNGLPTRINCTDLRDQAPARRRLAGFGVSARRKLYDIQLRNLKAGCYAKEGDVEPIQGCVCDPGCHACGYNVPGANSGDPPVKPTAANQCLACKDASHDLTFTAGEKTGICGSPTKKQAGCYESAVTWGNDDPIPGCVCHATCRTCGYRANPEPKSNGECLTCQDRDHVLRRGSGEDGLLEAWGRCTLPSEGTVPQVVNPAKEIWHGYQDRCNAAYYDYWREGQRAYNGCDDWLAANFLPLYIIDAPNESKVLDLNK